MNASFEQLHQDLIELANEAAPADLRDRALATSRRIGTRRTMVVSAVVVAVLAISAGTAYAVLPRRHAVPPVGPTPTSVAPSRCPTAGLRCPTQPTPTPSSGPSGTPSPTTTRPVGVPLHADARTTKIVNADITMPAWPGFASNCPAGVAHFHEGTAVISKSAGSAFQLHYEESSQALVGRAIFANLDGKSSDEAVITVGCYGQGSLNPIELLAVRLMPNGSVQTLGFVVTTPDHAVFDFDPLSVALDGNRILVEVEGDHRSNGGPLQAKQVRGYQYVSGAFKQVSGPTTFPPLPTDITKVDLSNTTIAFSRHDCGSGCTSFTPVRVSAGTGREYYVAQMKNGAYELTTVAYTIRKSVTITDRSHRTMELLWVAESGSGAEGSAAVYAVSLTGINGGAMADLVTEVGQDGITAISQIAGGSNVANVTVETASGEHVFTYAQAANDNWKKNK